MTTFVDPRTCKHDNTVLTRRPDKNGNDRFQKQCVACGQPQGSWIKRELATKGTSLEQIPLFDEQLRESSWKNLATANSTQVAFELKERFPVYQEYLRSDAWLAKRALVLQRAKGICEGCGIRKATQVHHFRYENLGDELLWDLAAVCEICHDKSHPWKLDDHGPYAEALRQRLHRQLENAPLFRDLIHRTISDRSLGEAE